MKPAEIMRVADAAKAAGRRILEFYLPGGQVRGKEYVVLNPYRDDQHAGSLSIEIATGRGGDFATGDTFGDFVGLVAFARKCKPGEAATELARFIGMATASAAPARKKAPPERTAVMPVPDDAPPPPKAHPSRGKPDACYCYRDAVGRVQFFVCRWEATGTERKYFSPLIWNGKEWRWQGPPVPRPLFALDLIHDFAALPIVVCEGEKSASALREAWPDVIATTWPNGSNAADKADWTPLKGRQVWVWPDHDEAGTQAALTAAKGIRKAGAASVKFVNLAVFAKHAVSLQGNIVARDGDLPEGWDAADAAAEGWTTATMAEVFKRDDMLLDALPDTGSDEEPVSVPEPSAEQSDDTDDKFLLADDGLYYLETTKVGDQWKVNKRRVCAPLTVPALGRDGESAGWGPVIEFRDRDGQRRREVIPYKLFLGQGFDGMKLLADLGLEIEPGNKPLEWLKAYIIGARPTRRARRLEQIGWHVRSFQLPDGTIGESDELLLFDGNRRALGVYATRGTLAQWQHLAHLAHGNRNLMFALALAFAGPLLKVLGLPGMAFHWIGDSSIGKSGALAGAGSVWGPTEQQVRSWRATDNALEYTAALANDTHLILDELREGDGKTVGAIVYMLGNSRGKGRAHHAGGLRDPLTWRIVLQSSGELGLADHLAAVGQKPYAGQEVRFIELEADAGMGHGMWHDVAGCADGGAQFTNLVKKSAARYYGTAGRAFVAELVKRIEDVQHRWRNHDHDFARDYRPTDAGGQVLRVMSAFSLAAFAGELATRWEITTWAPGKATAAAGELFRQWCRNRSSSANSEDAKIVAHVRGVMERCWQSRFVDWHRASGSQRIKDGDQRGDFSPDLGHMPAVHDALGFRKPDVPFDADNPHYLFYVTRARFADELAGKCGFKASRVAGVLKRHGVLRCDEDGSTWRETLPNGDPRSYCVIGQKLWALDL